MLHLGQRLLRASFRNAQLALQHGNFFLQGIKLAVALGDLLGERFLAAGRIFDRRRHGLERRPRLLDELLHRRFIYT